VKAVRKEINFLRFVLLLSFKKCIMKKLFILVSVFLFLSTACKKSSSSGTTCDKTVAGIAGDYGVTKIQSSLLGDITNTVLPDPCDRDDKVQLKADKTVNLVDAGTVCSPANTGSGSWDVVSGKITISAPFLPIAITNATITSYDCHTLVITADVPSVPPFPASTVVLTLNK
jgi:hypothetical protein